MKKVVRKILETIGEDPNRVGLLQTPERVVTSWTELYRGYDESCKPSITTFPNGQDGITYRELVIDTGVFYSSCEHHILPFFGSYVFAYIPSKKGNILGLSKVAHVVDYCSAKLQVQERLTTEIVDVLFSALSENTEPPRGIALMLKATHLCKAMRGVRREGSMVTSELRGLFKTNDATRSEFISLSKDLL